MGIGTWLAAMMAPLAARVLLGLGFSVVSIVGVSTALAQLKALFLAQTMLIPVAGLQLALLAGVGPALGIIFGAVTTRMALWQIQNATKILGVAS
jgi:hypothetical protein